MSDDRTDADQDWWKNLFDEIYLRTDARTVGDDRLTRQEVDFLEQTLLFEKSSPILDLCGGQGRHSLELSRRGYGDVTVLDYSRFLIDLGEKRAGEEKLPTRFVEADARDTKLPPESYGSVIVMAGSFGYFSNEAENRKILRETFRLLMSGGSLLLDLPNKTYIEENFNPQSWHEAEKDLVVCRQRRLMGGVLQCREMVMSKKKGVIRDETYCMRLYAPEKITDLLTTAGFHRIKIHPNFVSHTQDGDYGCMTNRMIVLARKP